MDAVGDALRSCASGWSGPLSERREAVFAFLRTHAGDAPAVLVEVGTTAEERYYGHAIVVGGKIVRALSQSTPRVIIAPTKLMSQIGALTDTVLASLPRTQGDAAAHDGTCLFVTIWTSRGVYQYSYYEALADPGSDNSVQAITRTLSDYLDILPASSS
jgi:hypothetical protein